MLTFFREQWHLLSFGILCTFTSGFGQSYFLGLFSEPLTQTFDLTYQDIGLLYLCGTLGSSLLLPLTGKWIDHTPLWKYVSGVYLCLALGALVMATAFHWIMLFPAYLLLRQCGQGLQIHTAMTAMARYYFRRQGITISIASMGLSLSEFIMPSLVTLLLVFMGWRWTWTVSAAAILLILPVALWLLKISPRVQGLEKPNRTQEEPEEEAPSWERKQALKQRFFYLFIIIFLCPGFVGTGLFFFQWKLGMEKGWPIELTATAFSAYAAVSFGVLLFGGPIINRIGAVRMVPLPFFLFSGSITILALGTSVVTPYIGMALYGLTIGLLGPTLNAVWGDAYGPRYLGAIRSLGVGIGIFSTAAAPALWGWLVTAGYTVSELLLWSNVWVALSIVVGFFLPSVRPNIEPLNPIKSVEGTARLSSEPT